MPNLPPPLTPAEADLRDFRFYPLDVVRFAQSGLATLEEPAEVLAAVLLWGAAWHNVPAGSLVDDDKQLAQLAGFGRSIAAWQEVRAGALRGWIECSDGRLYHPVVAEKVREAWLGKLKQRWRTYCGAIRQHNGRRPDDERESPSFEDWLDHGRPTTVVRGRKVPEQPDFLKPEDDSRDPARDPAHARVSEGDNVTRDNGDESRVTNGKVTRDSGGESHECHAENRSKGQGQGQGQGDSTSSTPREGEDLMGLTSRLAQLGGVSIINPRRIAMAMDTVKTWRADGIDVETIIVPAIEKRVASMREGDTIGSLAYFDADIRKVLALKGNGRASASPANAEPIDDRDDDDDRIPKIRATLSKALGARSYESWIGPKVVAMHVNGVGLVVKARSRFNADWIVDHFSAQLGEAAKAEGIKGVKVEPL